MNTEDKQIREQRVLELEKIIDKLTVQLAFASLELKIWKLQQSMEGIMNETSNKTESKHKIDEH